MTKINLTIYKRLNKTRKFWLDAKEWTSWAELGHTRDQLIVFPSFLFNFFPSFLFTFFPSFLPFFLLISAARSQTYPGRPGPKVKMVCFLKLFCPLVDQNGNILEFLADQFLSFEFKSKSIFSPTESWLTKTSQQRSNIDNLIWSYALSSQLFCNGSLSVASDAFYLTFYILAD